MTQTEQIVWHRCSDGFPPICDWYLVVDGDGEVDRTYWGDTTWHYKKWENYKLWAVLPRGRQDEKD